MLQDDMSGRMPLINVAPQKTKLIESAKFESIEHKMCASGNRNFGQEASHCLRKLSMLLRPCRVPAQWEAIHFLYHEALLYPRRAIAAPQKIDRTILQCLRHAP